MSPDVKKESTTSGKIEKLLKEKIDAGKISVNAREEFL